MKNLFTLLTALLFALFLPVHEISARTHSKPTPGYCPPCLAKNNAGKRSAIKTTHIRKKLVTPKKKKPVVKKADKPKAQKRGPREKEQRVEKPKRAPREKAPHEQKATSRGQHTSVNTKSKSHAH